MIFLLAHHLKVGCCKIWWEYFSFCSGSLIQRYGWRRGIPGSQIIIAGQGYGEINNDNMAREVNGLKEAMTETGAPEGIIITNNQEDNLDGIDLISAWKWM